MNIKTIKSAVNNRVMGYQAVELLNGAVVRISKTNGRISGVGYLVIWENANGDRLKSDFGSLASAKAFAQSLFN